jgi:hypothetical protein
MRIRVFYKEEPIAARKPVLIICRLEKEGIMAGIWKKIK